VMFSGGLEGGYVGAPTTVTVWYHFTATERSVATYCRRQQ